jgi:UrcA family protein
MLIAAPLCAQDYGPPPPGAYGEPPEDIIVTAPREPAFREEGSGTRGIELPPSKVSLASHVRYDDLDLTTWDGANELRWRVRQAARHVCGTLRDAYPVYQVPGTRCYKDAVQTGLVHADEVITIARQNLWYSE